MTRPTHAAARMATLLAARQHLATKLRQLPHRRLGFLGRDTASEPRRLQLVRDHGRTEHALLLCERVLLRDRLAWEQRLAGAHGGQVPQLSHGLARLEQRLAATERQVGAAEARLVRQGIAVRQHGLSH